jgi:hypothetical protein
MKSFAHTRSAKVSKKTSRSNSKDFSMERKKLLGPSFVGRKDHYEDQVNTFMDENIETIARLTALKEKL